jgi:hypothetical protein
MVGPAAPATSVAVAAAGDHQSAVTVEPAAPGEVVTAQRSRAFDVPRAFILDTDWWTDVGDTIALRVADYFQFHGAVKLLAVMLSTTFISGPGSAQSVMANDGIVGIPIGLAHTPNVPSGTPSFQTDLLTRGIARGYVTGNETYVDSLTLYRSLLAGSANAVDIITIGELNNLADLLQSPADAISPLTGLQLVSAKVRRLWIAGGQYQSGTEYNFSNNALAATSANYVVANWPTPIIYSGFEVGSSVLSGQSLVGLRPTDLVSQAMNDTGNASRPSWDGMGVLLPMSTGNTTLEGYSTISGTNSVNASSGANTFTPVAGARDAYVSKLQPDAIYAARINTVILKSTW